jgi:hypothetical protein
VVNAGYGFFGATLGSSIAGACSIAALQGATCSNLTALGGALGNANINGTGVAGAGTAGGNGVAEYIKLY